MINEPYPSPQSPVQPIEYRPSTSPPRAKAHWRLRAALWLVVLLVVAGASYLIYVRIHVTQTAVGAGGRGKGAGGPLPVVGATVRTGSLDLYLDGLGSVVPLNTVTVRSRVDGAIEKIAYTEGHTVKQGDSLLEIDPRPYQAALEQAQGQLMKDQAAKTNADWLVKQDQEALKTKAIAEQQLYTDTANRDQAAGAIEVDKAMIDNAKLNVEYCHITSPISGRIGLRIVDVGNIVHASETTGLAVITQLQPITVVFTLAEDVVNRVQQRMDAKAPVEVQAWDRDLRNKLSTGTVMAIDNQIDANSGTVKVKARFDNTDNRLFPNEFVNARLLVQTLNNAVLAPTAAVQHGPGATFVWTVGRDGAVKMQPVVTGATEGDDTAFTSGVAAGDVVVTDGVDKLADGMKVAVHAFASGAAAAQPASSQPSTRPHRRRAES